MTDRQPAPFRPRRKNRLPWLTPRADDHHPALKPRIQIRGDGRCCGGRQAHDRQRGLGGLCVFYAVLPLELGKNLFKGFLDDPFKTCGNGVVKAQGNAAINFGLVCRFHNHGVFLVLHVLHVNNYLALFYDLSYKGHMKGKSLTFRPDAEHRARLEALATATDRGITYWVEKAIEAQLPILEKKYEKDLREMEAKTGKESARTGEVAAPKSGIRTLYPSHREGEHSVVEENKLAKPPGKKRKAA
jgi:predicted transcriptional regulator